MVRGNTISGECSINIYDKDGDLFSTSKTECCHSTILQTFDVGHFVEPLPERTIANIIFKSKQISGGIIILCVSIFLGALAADQEPNDSSEEFTKKNNDKNGRLSTFVVLILMIIGLLSSVLFVKERYYLALRKMEQQCLIRNNFLDSVGMLSLKLCPAAIVVFIIWWLAGVYTTTLVIVTLTTFLVFSAQIYKFISNATSNKKEMVPAFLEWCSQCQKMRFYTHCKKKPFKVIRLAQNLGQSSALCPGPYLSYLVSHSNISNSWICQYVIPTHHFLTGEDVVKVQNDECIKTKFTLRVVDGLNVSILYYFPEQRRLITIDQVANQVVAFKCKEIHDDSEEVEDSRYLQLAWSLSGEVEGVLISPQGLAVDDLGRVYLADGRNERVVILDSTDGSVLQVLMLGSHCAGICDVKWRPSPPQLVVLHASYGNPAQISCFAIA